MLRCLLIVICLALSSKMLLAGDSPSKDEQRLIQIIENLGGTSEIDDDADGPARLVAKFDKLADNQLATLKGATCVLAIEVGDAKKCTDRGLEFLSTLKNLQRLSLHEPAVSDRGMAAFKSLTELRVIYFGGAKITDAGIAPLKPLTKLEELDIYATRVTDKSLAVIKEFENLSSLNLAQTKVTDAGMKQIKEMKKLKLLNLQSTAVTLPMIKSIEEVIPGIKVRR